MSLAEYISYCLIDPQTALIHHEVIQYVTALISPAPNHISTALAVTDASNWAVDVSNMTTRTRTPAVGVQQ